MDGFKSIWSYVKKDRERIKWGRWERIREWRREGEREKKEGNKRNIKRNEKEIAK